MMWEPAATYSFSIASYAVVFFMVLMGVIAVVASLKGHGGVLGVSHWIHWVGLANIGFLLAGVLLGFSPRYTRGTD